MARTQLTANKQILTFVQENRQKSAVKHSLGKPILLIFEDSFVQDCVRKHIVISNSTRTPYIYILFSISKDPFALKTDI